jgi:hypothetical protein
MHTLKPITLGLLVACVAACWQPAGAKDPVALSAFDWLAGHWCMAHGDELVEEYWLPPRGGMMLGLGRTLASGEARAFEFLRIELRDGWPTFVAQPNGVPPTPFRLTASGPGWARFENPEHDFPKRVEYRRTGQGLHAQIAGPGTDGRERVIPFDYRPCAGS